MNYKYCFLILPFLFCSCASEVGFRDYFNAKAQQMSSPELGVESLMEPGQLIYETYEAKMVEYISLLKPVKELMPGPLFTPFRFSIGATKLIKAFQAKEYSYFIAPEDDVNADLPGGLRLIRNEDILGVRVSQEGDIEWFVDSSAYNTDHIPRLWTKDVSEDDMLNMVHNKKMERVKAQSLQGAIKLSAVSETAVEIIVIVSSVPEKLTFPVKKFPFIVEVSNGQLVVLGIEDKKLKFKWRKLPNLYKGRSYLQ
jgi:hypothetical protein